jgi:hypothetical protein
MRRDALAAGAERAVKSDVNRNTGGVLVSKTQSVRNLLIATSVGHI